MRSLRGGDPGGAAAGVHGLLRRALLQFGVPARRLVCAAFFRLLQLQLTVLLSSDTFYSTNMILGVATGRPAKRLRKRWQPLKRILKMTTRFQSGKWVPHRLVRVGTAGARPPTCWCARAATRRDTAAQSTNAKPGFFFFFFYLCVPAYAFFSFSH